MCSSDLNIATSGNTHEVVGVDGLAGPFNYNIQLPTQRVWTVRVSAYNSQGYGPTAQPIAPLPQSVLTEYQKPGQVASATADALNQFQIRVQWTPPDPDLAVYSGAGAARSTSTLWSGTQTSPAARRRIRRL